MAEYNPGDKVVILEKGNERINQVATVLRDDGQDTYPLLVLFEDGHDELFYYTDVKPYDPAEKPAEAPSDAVNHPSHYGGKDNPYEVIKVAEAWGLDKDAYLFNVLKYIARAGKKGPKLEDLKKACFYANRRVEVEENVS